MDYTSISLNAIESRLEPSLALYADIIQHPAFRADDFQRARAQQISGIQQSNRSPGAIASRVMVASVFGPEHPYGRPASGTEATVNALSPSDAEAYHATWFRPDNATLVVVGDTTQAELVPALERAFRTWRAPAAPLPVKPAAPAIPVSHAPRIYIVDRAGPQSSIITGRLVAPFDPATEGPISVADTALGGAFTSRINMNLREDKHWSYGAGSFVGIARGERLFRVSSGVQADKTAESIAEIHRELSEVVGSRPLTEAEIAAVRSNLVLGMAGGWETNAAVADDLTRMVVYGVPENYYDGYAASVNGTTPQSASVAARALVGEGPTTWVVVGDRAQIEPKIRALGIGEVVVVDVNGQPVQ